MDCATRYQQEVQLMGKQDELITLPRAAKLVGLSSSTLYNYVERGWLQVYRMPSGAMRAKVSDVEALTRTPFDQTKRKQQK
jgi:predicted site-specific integrase-resolvase